MKFLSFFACIILLALSSCASGPTVANHLTPPGLLAKIATNPDLENGRLIAFYGNILHKERLSSGALVVQILSQRSPRQSIVVTFNAKMPDDIYKVSSAYFLARITGSHLGSNSYGGAVRSIAAEGIAYSSALGNAGIKAETLEVWAGGGFQVN